MKRREKSCPRRQSGRASQALKDKAGVRVSDLNAGIAGHKRAEEALHEREEVYCAIVNAAVEGIVLIDPGTLRFAEFNDAACQSLGYSREEFARISLPEIQGSLTPEETVARVKDVVRNGSGHFENQQRRKDGSLRDVQVTNRVVHIRGRDYVVTLWHDVTERNRREAVLREAEEKIRGVFDQTFQFIGLLTTDGVLIEANEAALQLAGIEKSAIIGKLFWETPWWAHSKELQEQLRDAVRRAARGETVRFEATHPAGDGTLHYVDFSLKPLKSQEGNIKYLITEGRDITALRQAERERAALEVQLRHAQKLEAIGRLAAGIAHEINTPLQYISDNTRFAQDAFQEIKGAFERFERLLQDSKHNAAGGQKARKREESAQTAHLDYLMEEVPKAIQDSLVGSGRITKIVRAMKEFSDPGSDNKTAVDLNRAIESTITVAHNEWKGVADVETDFDPELPLVPCLSGDFNQVILDILVNATHAIADVVGDGRNGKGKITVSTRRVNCSAEVRIADTGTGISESARSKIFDPFFTTKPVGKGSGQGLAIARSVVDKHRGSIDFETVMGKGTTFIIRLPLNTQLAEEVVSK